MADLFEIEGGIANLIDVEIPENGNVVGMKIQEIDIPEQYVVAAIIRDEEFVVPRGHTEIREADHVVVVGPIGSIQKAHSTFSASKK